MSHQWDPEPGPHHPHFSPLHSASGLGLTPLGGRPASTAPTRPRLCCVASQVPQSHELGVWQRHTGEVTAMAPDSWQELSDHPPSGGETTFPDASDCRARKGINQITDCQPSHCHESARRSMCGSRTAAQGSGHPVQCSCCWAPCPVLLPPRLAGPDCPLPCGWDRHGPRQHLPRRAVACLSHGVMSGSYLNEQHGEDRITTQRDENTL